MTLHWHHRLSMSGIRHYNRMSRFVLAHHYSVFEMNKQDKAQYYFEYNPWI